MRHTRDGRARPLFLLAILALVALLLAACEQAEEDPAEDGEDVGADTGDEDEGEGDEGEGDEGDEGDDEASGDGDEFLVLGTGSTGGTYYPLGGAIAEQWNAELGLSVSTQATGASVENLRLLGEELDLIMAVNGVAFDAIDSTGEFEGEEHDFRSLGNVYPEVLQIVARADSGIESIEDLEGARVAIGPPGSGTEVVARRLLEYVGLDADSDIEAFSETFGDATDQLQDGTVDAAFAILALPAGGIEEVATSTDIVIVNIDGDPQEQLLADDESYSVLDVPAGTYTGFDEDAVTVANWATMYVEADFDEELAYDMTRVMYENNDAIADTIAVGEQIQVDTALDGLGPIELHPGAERFFEEQGALD